jgi:hypothetical protein
VNTKKLTDLLNYQQNHFIVIKGTANACDTITAVPFHDVTKTGKAPAQIKITRLLKVKVEVTLERQFWHTGGEEV